MYFQNIEFFETDKFQYLLIHRNACTSVLKCIDKYNPEIVYVKSSNKIKWTVIRDPYERFISGLNYDLKRHKMSIEDVNLERLFVSYVNSKSRIHGNVNHTISQVLYLANTDIDWYVDINDLDLFLKIHFNTTFKLNSNSEKNIFFDKKEVMKYLQLDYEVYNRIKSSTHLWEWQKGKIF
jgi:hypothetical protein